MNSSSFILISIFISFLNINNKVNGTETLISLSNECMSSLNTAYLNNHNSYRKLHGSVALKQNNTIVGYAQKWANYLAENDILKQNGSSSNSRMGANLAFSYSSKEKNINHCAG